MRSGAVTLGPPVPLRGTREASLWISYGVGAIATGDVGLLSSSGIRFAKGRRGSAWVVFWSGLLPSSCSTSG